MITPGKNWDWRHIRTLVRTGLRLDWRGANNPFVGFGVKRKTSAIPGMVGVMALTGFTSLFMGILFFQVTDFFTGLVLSATGIVVIISLQLLIDFGQIIISPDDFNIVSPQPVSSKTFYYAKLAHLFIYVSMMSLTASVFPAIFAYIKFGNWRIIPILVIDYWLSVLYAAALVMIIYTLVLKYIDRRRLERFLGYAQVVMVMCSSLSMILIMMRFDPESRDRFEGVFALITNNIEFLPTYWLAGPVKLFSDGWDAAVFGYSALGYVSLFLLLPLAISYLSLSYAESLNRATWDRSQSKKKVRRKTSNKIWNRLLNNEDRAVIRLARANFRHDVKFRLGVLTAFTLPLAYVILVIFMHGNTAPDLFNFEKNEANMIHMLIWLAVNLIPFMLGSALVGSKHWQASWVFFSIPLDRKKLANSISKIVIAIAILPISILGFLIYIYFVGNAFHAVLHTITLIAFGMAATTFASLIVITLPFSTEFSSGNLVGSYMMPFFVWMVVSMSSLIVLTNKGYGGYLNWAIIVASILIVRQIMVYMRNRRLRKKILAWEFLG